MRAYEARLTIAVYRVDPETGERRTVRPEVTYRGDATAVYGLGPAWPPCRCTRCADDGVRR
ncbi:hypothetical protein [Streptomyces gobiensis]|uniref:hypothetical protein n=1 Tax=Streptomyces gobiensis TaxID=2875706 RepID=UPI001E4A005A|nr:hypothetical protein [Streptomyces gobiensis]UGY93542.1 hypothetical protein test1122_18660 [Streptomyces gobiensis]